MGGIAIQLFKHLCWYYLEWYFQGLLSKFIEKYVGYHDLDKAMESSARPTPDGIFRLDKQADYNNAGRGGAWYWDIVTHITW